MKTIFNSAFLGSIRAGVLTVILTAGVTQAAMVDGLYEAEVLVRSQSSGERDKAMSEALAQVLKKVSGRSNPAGLQGIAGAIKNPNSYLQQYLYRSVNEARYPIPQAAPNSQLAWFRFDEEAVNRVLRDNGLPVWGRTRPATLVWLAVEENGARYMLGSDSAEQLRDSLEYEAQRQGMALVLPLLDLQDQRAVSFADLWGDFQDSILSASSRYRAESILVGRLSMTRSDAWLGRWTLYESGRNFSWQTQGNYAEEALSAGVGSAVETLANQYARGDEHPGVAHLAVTGVSSLKEFARVTSYLSSLEVVKDLQPAVINDTTAIFRLDIRGNAESLAQTIRLGHVLQEERVAIESPASNTAPAANFFGVSPSFIDSEQTQTSSRESPDYTYRLMP